MTQEASAAVEGVYINLDRAVERRAAMEAQLARLRPPYAFARFAAVDGAKQPGSPKGLRPGQYGCWLSHFSVLERSLSSERHLHVLEDDVRLSARLGLLPEALGMLAADPASAWDVLYLDATLVEIADMYQMFDWVRQARRDDLVQVCRLPAAFTVYGLHSYIVNGARKRHVYDFVKANLGFRKPIDDLFAIGIREGVLKACVTAPFLSCADETSADSTVGYPVEEGFPGWFAFRRLCFADLTSEEAARLSASVAGFTRAIGPEETIFGALCSYRLAHWPPNSRFTPERPE